jgi:class 3 adenylate cyclase
VLADYQRLCSEVAEHHDGHIAQYLGDGVLICVGRERERTALQNHWQAVKSGDARFVTVRGEAGIGKSLSSGWSRLHMGDRADGLRELFEGVTLFRATRSDLMGPTVGVIHREGLRAAGRPEKALDMLAVTAETAHRGHVGVLLPDVYRLMGEIHLDLGRLDDAENAFQKAVATAAAQKALSLELRAAISYHDVLVRTGRRGESLAFVRRCYERFSDSLSQPDLIRARTMLEEAGEREVAAR